MTRYYDVRGDTSGTDEDNTLNIWYQEGGEPDDLMPVRHRHNAVELNYIAEGTVTYIFFGHPVRIEAERLALFWGSIPHRIVEIHKPLSFYSMHIPLALFLDSGLPEGFVHRLLGGQVAVEVNGEQAQRDLLLFRREPPNAYRGHPKRHGSAQGSRRTSAGPLQQSPMARRPHRSQAHE